MTTVQIPKTVEERVALKKEIIKFLQDHGADAKSRTVTLKHFMQTTDLPPVFIKRSMGRIGLADKQSNKKQSDQVARAKLKLQKRVQRFLGSAGIVNQSMIQKLYDTLKQEGFKRRHIRTALYTVAGKLRSKYGAEAASLLTSLIKNQPEPAKSSKPKTQNNKAPAKTKPKTAEITPVKPSILKRDSKLKNSSGKRISFGDLKTPQDETPLNRSLQNGTPQNKTPPNKTPPNKTPQNQTPLNTSPLNKSPLNKSPLNKSLQNGTPPNKTPPNKTPKTKTPQNKTPQNQTPLNSRNLIDLNTPSFTPGILDEECPSLVPIVDEPLTPKRKTKSPKFSPRLTRSAARKKLR